MSNNLSFISTDITSAPLFIVATPIGNLEDMTFRAVRILKTVDLIAAEDTRHTGKLLQHFQITTPQISYHEHNQQQRIPELLTHLLAGKAIALVTDAGIPLISDPGYELVKTCIDANILVIPIPGANAAITALSASGLPTDKFIFEGFLPSKNKDKQARLKALKDEYRTMILYESPHHLLQTLQDLSEVLGEDRRIVLGRELTKLYEEFWRGTISEAISHYSQRQPQGEFTLVISGGEEISPQLSPEEIITKLQTLMAEGISRSQACRQVAQETSLSRSLIYQISLTVDHG